MQFRPCIDIHNGRVKQIVGSSIGGSLQENFVSEKNATYYALLYKKNQIKGGHMILLNAPDDPYYTVTKMEAMDALALYPGGLQVGGGISADNAAEFIQAGASHVIVTSYVFQDGKINYDNLERLVDAVGRNHIVLDLSAKKYPEGYVIMTDRWQVKSDIVINVALLEELSAYCDEFLIHSVDVEGKNRGIEQNLVKTLSDYRGIPVTYAGGISTYEDMKVLRKIGNNRINMTVGSALDLFGGKLEFKKIVAEYHDR